MLTQVAAVVHGNLDAYRHERTFVYDTSSGSEHSLDRSLGHYSSHFPGTYYSSQNNYQHPNPSSHKPSSHYSIGTVIYHPSSGYEPQAVPCYGELTPFTAEVFVDFDGDPALVTYRDIDFLEQGFRRVYDVLSKQLCDSKFRETALLKLLIKRQSWSLVPLETCQMWTA